MISIGQGINGGRKATTDNRTPLRLGSQVQTINGFGNMSVTLGQLST
jgi:hypothetical protein